MSVEESEERAESGSAKPVEVVAKRGRLGYPLIIATIVGVGLLLVVQSSFSSGSYSLEIDVVQEKATRYLGRDVKIVGVVAEGTIETRTDPSKIETHFQIHDGKGHTLSILYPHNPPDPFKEGRQVIVEGVLEKGEDGKERVLCQKLTVKCPSKYQEEGLADSNADDYYRKKYGSPTAGEGTY